MNYKWNGAAEVLFLKALSKSSIKFEETDGKPGFRHLKAPPKHE